MLSLTKKQITVGAVIGVWVAGAASAGAIAFALNRPLRLPGVAAFDQPLAAELEIAEPSEATLESVGVSESLGSMDEIWVFGKPDDQVSASAPATKQAEEH